MTAAQAQGARMALPIGDGAGGGPAAAGGLSNYDNLTMIMLLIK